MREGLVARDMHEFGRKGVYCGRHFFFRGSVGVFYHTNHLVGTSKKLQIPLFLLKYTAQFECPDCHQFSDVLTAMT